MIEKKNVQWNAFINKLGLSADKRSLQEIASILVDFLMAGLALRRPTKVYSSRIGKPPGPWK